MPIEEHARLIKAVAARRLAPATTWNGDDLGRECDELIAEARRQADRLLAQTYAECDELRCRAQAEGHACGLERGLDAARDEIERRATEVAADEARRRMATALPALEALASGLDHERERWAARWESAAVQLSVAIAQRIVRREVAGNREIAPELVREALQLAAGSRQITVRLNPIDFESCRPACELLRGGVAPLGEVQWIADDTLTPGGCLVETQQGQIDARIETQLDRITAELLA